MLGCYIAKRPSHTTNKLTFQRNQGPCVLAVTALKTSNLNSAVWDHIFIFCCTNRPPHAHRTLLNITLYNCRKRKVSREWKHILSGTNNSWDYKSQRKITFAPYNLVLKRFSVRESHNVTQNKTHAEIVASKASEKSKFTNSSLKNANYIFTSFKLYKILSIVSLLFWSFRGRSYYTISKP